ncbi:hypothetical protein KAR91_30725 [Candidatus Pacearchaeota archaeon]|nr:hypothetical protein [Candidatus Pacearchaeota archaeon]
MKKKPVDGETTKDQPVKSNLPLCDGCKVQHSKLNASIYQCSIRGRVKFVMDCDNVKK